MATLPAFKNHDEKTVSIYAAAAPSGQLYDVIIKQYTKPKTKKAFVTYIVNLQTQRIAAYMEVPRPELAEAMKTADFLLKLL